MTTLYLVIVRNGVAIVTLFDVNVVFAHVSVVKGVERWKKGIGRWKKYDVTDDNGVVRRNNEGASEKKEW